jgi:molybdenum cofactor cytidylyltransferase
MPPTNPPRIAALLLAAGESRRMGRLKALLPWKGSTLLQSQLASLQGAGLSPVILVLGHRAQDLLPLAKPFPDIRIVLNPHYKQGKTTSIKAGLASLHDGESDAILILNVDQPRSPDTLQRIVEAHHRSRASITIPTYQGKGGHPVIYDITLLPQLLAISEDTQGLKALTHNSRHPIHRFDAATPEVTLDLNTEEDYRRAIV